MRRVRQLKMSPECKARRAVGVAVTVGERAAGAKSMRVLPLVALLVGLMVPSSASAHGPVDPAASSYLAVVTTVAPGVQAKAVDGDQRLWLRVDPRRVVVVLDYRGAPYLRFSPAGVQVNENSAMYYLNQVPAQTPPAGLGSGTPPRWAPVTSGHEYEWHDGRLHALATTALAPGATYAGRWTVPLRLAGGNSIVAGALYYAPNPSLVWFWPIVVAVACVLAALRVRRTTLDQRLARALALGALIAFAVAGAGQQLHGRPSVSAGQLIVLAIVAAFTAWGLVRLVRRRHGWFTFFAVSVAALWEGVSLLGVLLHGFVLMALPAFVARAAVVTLLATGIGLLPLVFRMAERSEGSDAADPTLGDEFDTVDEDAWERNL